MFDGISFSRTDLNSAGKYIFELAKKTTAVVAPKAFGVSTGDEIVRVPPKDLELIYATDPIFFNGVGNYIGSVLSSDPHIVCSNDREQRIIDDFSKDVRLFRFVLPKMVQNMCIYGNAWNEILYAKPTTKEEENDVTLREILGLPTRDPKAMDFRRREINKKIWFNDAGETISYVQYLEYDIEAKEHEIYQCGRRAIEFPKERILHTPFFSLGDSPDGVGLIEPAYNDAIGKNNARKGLINSIYRLGFPLVDIEVGNEEIFPTEEMITKAGEAFKDINEKSVIAHPHYTKPAILESRKPASMQDNLNYFIDSEVTSLGQPKAIATGSGEATNRSTLQTQMIIFYQRVEWIQNMISISMEDQVLEKIYISKNFDEIPKLEWGEVNTESLSKKSERLASYVKSGVLTPDENLEEMIRKYERLPPLDKKTARETKNPITSGE